MARLQHGPVVSSASGRIGRIVIRQTRFGPVAQTAYDVPPYTTPKALAAKARFRTAQNAWSIMPSDLSGVVGDIHRKHAYGVPGPWITAMLAYMVGQPWKYPPATHPGKELAIESVEICASWWYVHFRETLAMPWNGFWSLTFHATEGVNREYGWQYGAHEGDKLIVPYYTCPHGWSFVILPTLVTSFDVLGRGDAVVLP